MLDDFTDLKYFLMAVACTEPRILGLFIALPIFNRNLLPGMLRLGVAASLGLMVAPTLVPTVSAGLPGAGALVLLAAKEAFIGFVMGLLVAVPFYAFEAIGFLVDNQRGASIAATLNPLTGNDSSPLGLLFNQAFIVFFFISGGFLVMLEVLYQSFALWDVFTWLPTLRPEAMPQFTQQVLRLVELALVLSAPVIIAMFLAELGLALVSVAVPQLQVFFLAMPIKSGLALLVLILYVATLFHYGEDHLPALREIVPTLDGLWRGGGAR